jgi:hypothetical protein
MKLQGKITMLVNTDYTTIQIEDSISSTLFCEVTLSPEQLSAILSRLACVSCELELHGLEKIGKTHECKTFEFEISEKEYKDRDSVVLKAKADSLLKDEWVAEDYFNSQNSFFKKEKKQYARCTIRRWV